MWSQFFRRSWRQYPKGFLYEFPSFNFFADDEKAIPVYEPSEIPEDPNRIKETDCEVVKLVKELLDTYPLFRVILFFP